MKIVIGITGASGSIYAIRLIEVLKLAGHELHVVLTDSGEKVIQYECGKTIDDLRQMSDVLYDIHDVGAVFDVVIAYPAIPLPPASDAVIVMAGSYSDEIINSNLRDKNINIAFIESNHLKIVKERE